MNVQRKEGSQDEVMTLSHLWSGGVVGVSLLQSVEMQSSVFVCLWVQKLIIFSQHSRAVAIVLCPVAVERSRSHVNVVQNRVSEMRCRRRPQVFVFLCLFSKAKRFAKVNVRFTSCVQAFFSAFLFCLSATVVCNRSGVCDEVVKESKECVLR